jgi:integrase
MKGSIVTRTLKDGTKRYDAVWTAAGKQRWKTFQRRRDADNFLVTTVKSVHDGTYQDLKPTPMDAVFTQWLRHLQTQEHLGKVKFSTARCYRLMVEQHYRPAFGQYRSDRLTAEVIHGWTAQLAERIAKQDLRPKTYNNLIVLLKSIFKWARRSDQRYLRHDPMEHVERLAKQQTEREILEPADLWQLLKAAEKHPPADVILKVAAFTGLRRGELFGLQWGDLQRHPEGGGRLLIRRSIVLGRVTTPKTTGSFRVVDVPQGVIDELLLYQSAYPPVSEWMFPNAAGGPIDGDNWSKRVFLPLIQGLGFRQRIGLHSLRHTYVSLLIAQGENIKYISRQVGHSTIAMTMDTYGHLLQETSQIAMQRLDQRLRVAPLDDRSSSNGHLMEQAKRPETTGDDQGMSEDRKPLKDRKIIKVA